MRIEDELQHIVETFEPDGILAVTGDDVPLPDRGGPYRIERIHGLSDLGTADHYDLAIVDSAASFPETEVPMLLSRLRDLNARRVLVVVRPGASGAWTRHSLIGFGYTHRGQATIGEQDVDLFQFDIDTYKHTPDWLNPSNWANPELWDRYRW
ncbi:MAG TPA: DUF6231 family protein [Gammaproteobacteria bacterium]|nr:DUF6231 family protein [Gammaproteobacteria bacterium]